MFPFGDSLTRTMKMNIYDHSRYAVDEVLSASHARCREALVPLAPGGPAPNERPWWQTSAPRVAAGVAESDGDAAPLTGGRVNAIASEVARAVALRPESLDVGFYHAARDAGLGEEEYVETVAVPALTCDLDIFARGLGVAPLAVCAVDAGEPPRARPVSARARRRPGCIRSPPGDAAARTPKRSTATP